MRRNFVYTAVSVSSRLLTSLFLFLLLARLWGAEEFGAFSFMFSLAAMLALGVDFGFQSYLLREIGANPTDAGKLISEAFSTKLVLLGLVAAPCFILFGFFYLSISPALSLPLLLAAFFTSFSEFFIAPLRALGRYDLETVVVTAGNMMMFSVAVAAALFGKDAATVALIIAGARLLQFALSFLLCRRIVSGLTLDIKTLRSCFLVARRAFPYGFDTALVVAWNHVDVIFVRFVYGDGSVGVYAAGQKLVQGACALAPVVGNVMIPRLAKEGRLKEQSFIKTSLITQRLLLSMGLLFSVPLLLASDVMVEKLFGPSFVSLSDFLWMFSAVLLFRYIAAGYGVLLTAVGHQKKRVFAQILAFLVFLFFIFLVWLLGLSLKWVISALVLSSFFLVVSYRYLWLAFKSHYSKPQGSTIDD